MKRIISLLLLAIVLDTTAPAATWVRTKDIPLGGEGGWDYLAVQPGGGRLFVTHANQVLILDLRTQGQIGSIDAAGAHGVAFAPDLNRGFISNGTGGTVTFFDLKTLKPIRSTSVGQNPDAICYEPTTKRVFAFNGPSGTVSALDAVTGEVIRELPLPGRPEFAGVDGAGFVFDNIEDKGLVIKIDAAKLDIVARWALPPGSSPSALAVDPVGHRLFVGCGEKVLYVLDSDRGGVIAKLPIGKGVDADVYDAVGKRVLASCGDGTLTVIDEKSPDDYVVEAQVKTQKGARTLAFDSSTQTAYLPVAQFGPPAAPTPEHPRPRPTIVPGTLKILVFQRHAAP
jgi:DNA-binding beta-propeller fold protein YncE